MDLIDMFAICSADDYPTIARDNRDCAHIGNRAGICARYDSHLYARSDHPRPPLGPTVGAFPLRGLEPGTERHFGARALIRI